MVPIDLLSFQPRRWTYSRNARSCAPVFCSPELTRTYSAARFVFTAFAPRHVVILSSGDVGSCQEIRISQFRV
jgi:hypothetical protein